MKYLKKSRILETKINFWGIVFGLPLAWWLINRLVLTIGTATPHDLVIWLFTGLYLLISAQALGFLYWTLYAWNDPEEVEKNKSPKEYLPAKYSFTALLPARHEEAVIDHTIRSIAGIDYPEDMKELLVLIRSDDAGTIAAAENTIAQLGQDNVKLVVVDDLPVNKPNQLNWGLARASKEVVVVFDAEDEPHKDIYNVANTVMIKKKADVVQSGVQLVNFRSHWFSLLNVLEYYFWFKSALHFFSKTGVVPLGGNTVFFKRSWLTVAGGWDEKCLTEDGEIGIRLSLMGAKIAVVYDEVHATQEETPNSLAHFVKQRTRWNMGYLQILAKGEWLKYPKLRQKLLALYLLVLPVIIAGMVLTAPILTAIAIAEGLPMLVSLLSFLPLALLTMQFVVSMVGMYQFAREYKQACPWWMPIKMSLVYVPYMLVLVVSSVRAVIRFLAGNLAWEKTHHANAHRNVNFGYSG